MQTRQTQLAAVAPVAQSLPWLQSGAQQARADALQRQLGELKHEVDTLRLSRERDAALAEAAAARRPKAVHGSRFKVGRTIYVLPTGSGASSRAPNGGSAKGTRRARGRRTGGGVAGTGETEMAMSLLRESGNTSWVTVGPRHVPTDSEFDQTAILEERVSQLERTFDHGEGGNHVSQPVPPM